MARCHFTHVHRDDHDDGDLDGQMDRDRKHNGDLINDIRCSRCAMSVLGATMVSFTRQEHSGADSTYVMVLCTAILVGFQ